MKYLNLDTLKIEESDDFWICTRNIHAKDISSIKKIQEQINIDLKDIDQDFSGKDKPIYFIVNLLAPKDLTPDEFLSLINITVSGIINRITLDKGRARERRLDVPEELKKDCHLSVSLLKRAINAATLSDRFTIMINCDEYTYRMV